MITDISYEQIAFFSPRIIIEFIDLYTIQQHSDLMNKSTFFHIQVRSIYEELVSCLDRFLAGSVNDLEKNSGTCKTIEISKIFRISNEGLWTQMPRLAAHTTQARRRNHRHSRPNVTQLTTYMAKLPRNVNKQHFITIQGQSTECCCNRFTQE